MVFAGANMVPMEELEGRMDGGAHRILVKSSADAGMNTLRVWGGGMFFPEQFYDACDECVGCQTLTRLCSNPRVCFSFPFLILFIQACGGNL
jgi:hypothetical protein